MHGARRKVLALAGVATGLALIPSEAWGQANPPKIHQQALDDFGVERKTGRFGLPIPPLLTIGGSEDAILRATFGYVDGADFQQNVPVWIRFNGGVYDGKSGKVYDYVTVELNGTSETFRRITNSTGAYTAEYPTGSTLSTGTNTASYTNKFNDRVTLANGIYTVDYPDGRQIRMYAVPGYGGSAASFIDFTGNSPDRTVVNNFGYAIRLSRGDAYYLQAVNLAQDYCDLASSGSCSTSRTRQASIRSSGLTRVLTDAAGGSWSYRFVKINANDRMRVRNQYGSGCDAPTSADYWYPAGITPPGAGGEVYSISYSLRAPAADCTQDPTHDDVFVSSVIKGDQSAGYTTTKRSYGSYGSNPYNLSYWIDISAQVGQRGNDFSEANRPNQEWGASRRSFVSTKDRLGRQVTYNFNDLVEPAGTTYPLGNAVQLTYDARFNVTQQTVTPVSGSNQAPLVTIFTYPASCTAQNQAFCNKPLTMVDPRGGQTDYSYNTAGQITSQTLPAAPDGTRPRKVFSYTMRTAYIKDAGGNPVAAGPAISMLVQTIDCTTFTPCTGTADEIVTDIDYGPASGLNNLKPRGVAVTAKNATGSSETRRTCYTYNYFGEQASETKPLGTSGGCQ